MKLRLETTQRLGGKLFDGQGGSTTKVFRLTPGVYDVEHIEFHQRIGTQKGRIFAVTVNLSPLEKPRIHTEDLDKCMLIGDTPFETDFLNNYTVKTNGQTQ